MWYSNSGSTIVSHFSDLIESWQGHSETRQGESRQEQEVLWKSVEEDIVLSKRGGGILTARTLSRFRCTLALKRKLDTKMES